MNVILITVLKFGQVDSSGEWDKNVKRFIKEISLIYITEVVKLVMELNTLITAITLEI